MDRRTRIVVLATVFVMLVVIAAASSGSVRVWITPPSDATPSSVVPEERAAVEPITTAISRTHVPAWVGAALQVIGLIAVLLAAAFAVSETAATRFPRRWRERQQRKRQPFDPLPEVQEQVLTVDTDAARSALRTGAPRNAIVACWLRLEHDAAMAGLERSASETAAEYVERVVTASSIDPQPIRELAALYREARFSEHELGEDHRVAAIAALDRVLDALGQPAEVGV